MDAFGIETIGGLVEDQDLRVAQQRRGEPEPLAHTKGELADPAVGGASEIYQIEHFIDPPEWGSTDEGFDAEVVACGAAGIGVRGFQGGADDVQRESRSR